MVGPPIPPPRSCRRGALALLACAALGGSGGSSALAAARAPLDRAAALALARGYYERAASRIEPELRPAFARLVVSPPRFDGGARDPARAAALSGQVAVLVGWSDARNLYVAAAAAAFDLDPASAVAAGNLASAVATHGEEEAEGLANGAERDRRLAPFQEDAVALYRYGVGAARAGAAAGAAPLLVNLGNLLVDMRRLDEARAALDEALRLAPRSWPAHRALAGWYLASGRRDLAEKELANREGWPASYRRAAAARDRTSPEVAPPVDPGDDEPTMEAKLAKLRAAEPVSMADLVGDLDAHVAAEMRRQLREIERGLAYAAPGLGPFVAYGNLEAFSRPIPQLMFAEWARRWGEGTARPMAIQQAKEQLDVLRGFGIEVDVDPEQELRRPVGGKRPRPKVKGVEELKAWAASLKAKTAKTRGGRDAQALGEVVKEVDRRTHHGASVLLLDPEAFANPADVIVQQVNFTLLDRKRLAHHVYLTRVLDRLAREIEAIQERAAKEYGALVAAEEEELARLEERARVPPGVPDYPSRRHEIHERYHPRLNAVASLAWAGSTQIANAFYLQRLKPAIEAMWLDCSRHVLLVSDPEVRVRQQGMLAGQLSALLQRSLTLVARSYGGAWRDPWDCDCDLEALAAARQREQAEREAAQEEARRRNREARADFEEGGIPETSALYQKIDAYTARLSLPFAEVRVGYLTSSLRLRLAGSEGDASAAATLELVSDHMRNKRRFDFELEAATKGEAGAVSLEGRAWTRATVTWGEGASGEVVVKHWDWTAGADASAKVGTGTVVGQAQVEVEARASYETSVMRGSSASAELGVSASRPGPSLPKGPEVGGGLPVETDAAAGRRGGEDARGRLVLWSGKYAER